MRLPALVVMWVFAMAGVLVSAPGSGAGTVTYRDPSYGFTVTVPGDFVVRAQDVATLPFTPRPLASVFVMNPVMARGQLAGKEPPDLEVRVYDAGAATSLEAWLEAARFASAEALSAATPQAINGLHGLRICRQDLLAPGCATFLMQGARIYQLTAVSAEGERMIDSFALVAP